MLRADGYLVRPSANRFDSDALDEADILVISKALHERNLDLWLSGDFGLFMSTPSNNWKSRDGRNCCGFFEGSNRFGSDQSKIQLPL